MSSSRCARRSRSPVRRTADPWTCPCPPGVAAVDCADPASSGNLIGFLACAALMGYALFVQHVLGLEPCPLCILQRVAVIGRACCSCSPRCTTRRARRAHLWLADSASRRCRHARSPARHMWIMAQPPGTVAECGASSGIHDGRCLPLREVLGKVLSGSGECAQGRLVASRADMPTWVLTCSARAWRLCVNICGAKRATTF